MNDAHPEIAQQGFMKKTKLDVLHYYFIEEIIGHLYVADRTVKLGKHYKIENDGDKIYLITQIDPEDTLRKRIYREKCDALKALEKIK